MALTNRSSHSLDNDTTTSNETGTSPSLLSRTIAHRRPGLPNARAAIGALLVLVSVSLVFVAASRNNADTQVEYLVAADHVEAGQIMSIDDVEVRSEVVPPGLGEHLVNSTIGLEGARALSDVLEGQPLDVRNFVAADRIDAGDVTSHVVSLPVEVDRVPRSLVNGDRVTVLAFDGATTWVAAEDVEVLSMERSEDSLAGSTGELTLTLDDADAVVALAHRSFNDLTVIHTSRAIDDDYPTNFTTPLSIAVPSEAVSQSDDEAGQSDEEPGQSDEEAG